MDRRAAVALMASTLLAGCGGGGGDGLATNAGDTAGAAPPPAPAPAPVAAPAAAPGPAPAPVPAPPVALSQNIAAWGDSLTPPFANNLQLLFPGRTVFDGGIVGQTSTEIAARETSDTAGHNAWISIFWYGHNNDDQPEQIKADIAKSIAALAPGNTRFIVLAMLNKGQPNELKGTPQYFTTVNMDAELATTYPQNYIDIRSYLISQFDPSNPQDLIDVVNDVLPTSMRFDQIHMNNTGSLLVAQRVAAFIAAKGW
jgi:lysophospholipase L1-like esterase